MVGGEYGDWKSVGEGLEMRAMHYLGGSISLSFCIQWQQLHIDCFFYPSLQELRSQMDCYTALVVVGGGDDLVSSTSCIASLCQTW